MFIICVIDLLTKNENVKTLGNRKKVFFSYFVSEISNLSYMLFFRECSMFCRIASKIRRKKNYKTQCWISPSNFDG